jgi:hypothetical protein
MCCYRPLSGSTEGKAKKYGSLTIYEYTPAAHKAVEHAADYEIKRVLNKASRRSSGTVDIKGV